MPIKPGTVAGVADKSLNHIKAHMTSKALIDLKDPKVKYLYGSVKGNS